MKISFLRQFFIYGVGGVASRLAALVLIPLYTFALSVSEYGILEILLAIHALAVLMGGLQVESAVARDYQRVLESESQNVYRWTALWLTLGGTLIVSFALALAWWTAVLPKGLQGGSIIWLLALTAPAQIFSVQLIMLRFSGRAIAFAILSFTDLSASGLFSWIYIVALDQGLNGALFGLLSSKIMCIAIAWPLTFGHLRYATWSRATAGEMLAYGVPALPALFVNWVQNQGSRIMLAGVLTVQDVALAGLAMKVASLYGFVVYSFRLAWEPYAMARLNELHHKNKDFGKTLDRYIATMFLCCGLSVALGPTVVGLLSPAVYANAGLLAGAFIVGQFWVGVTNIMVIGIQGSRKTIYMLPVYVVGMLINIALLLSLAPIIGVASAGIGFLGGAVGSAMMAAYYSNRLFNTDFRWRLISVTIFGSVLMLCFLQFALVQRIELVESRIHAPLDFAIGLAVTLPLTATVLWLGCGSAKARLHLQKAMGLVRKIASTCK